MLDNLLKLLSKLSNPKDWVLATLPSVILFLLDAAVDIIPWLTEEETGGIFAILGYSLSKLYDWVMGGQNKRKEVLKSKEEQLKRASNFVIVLKKILKNEKISNAKLEKTIHELILKIEHKMSLLEGDIISTETFTEDLDKLIAEYDRVFEESIK